jgi:hypothetical protein
VQLHAEKREKDETPGREMKKGSGARWGEK